MKRVIHLSGILTVSLHTLIILDRAWELKLLLMDQHIHEPLEVCKTSVFISLWSSAKGPEKKAISSQPWIEYWVSVTLPHTFGPAGLDTVLYVYKSMKGEISNMPNAFRHLFADVLEKLCIAFRRCPTNTCSRYTTPCLKSLHSGPLTLIAFLCTTLLASFACKSYGLTKQNHSKRTQLRRFGCCKIPSNCQIKFLFAFQTSLDV